MLLTLLATSFVLQGAQPAPPRSLSPAKAAALHDSLEAAALRFFREFGVAWRNSEGERHAVGSSEFETTTRNLQLHCHPAEPGAPPPQTLGLRLGRTTAITQQPTIVKSPDSHYAVCPTWTLSEVKAPGDERTAIDLALTQGNRKTIGTARAALLDELDSAARLLPSDDWIAGQRVRFRVDQRDLDTALFVARACEASRWWCTALRGYVHALRAEIVIADSVFGEAVAAMRVDQRCQWTDLTELIGLAERPMYARLSCRQRDSVNTRLWWLADPLYIEPANERRVEQHVRNVIVALHSALDHDERFDWRPTNGFNALQRVIARYGWPAYTWWGGVRNERSHSDYLATHHTAMNDTYASFEYPFERMHAFPSWHAVTDPLHAKRTDWEIARPDSMPGDSLWWPREHFATRNPLLQISDGQLAFLRRQDTVLFAMAADLEQIKFHRPRTDPVRATAVLSGAPGDYREVAHAEGSTNAPLLLRANVPSKPALLSVEFPADLKHALPGGRTRFAIAPPAPLSALKTGQYAISDPIVLLPPPESEILPSDVDGALARMAGSTVVRKVRRLGVYWETYGFKPGDSVDVAVWIERYTPQGIIRRFGIALNVAVDLNTPIVISWKEPQPQRIASLLPGRVPILGRSLTIDVSALPAGDYWLDVAVGKRGVQPVRGRRGITIR